MNLDYVNDRKHRIKGQYKRKMLLITMCKLGILNPEQPRYNKIAIIKNVRMFTGTLSKLNLMRSALGLKEAKDWTEAQWPERYKSIIYNSI